MAHDFDQGYSTEDQVEDISALIRALRLPQLTLIGHSMGGNRAWQFAAAHPEAVERLVIEDSVPQDPPSPPPSLSWPKEFSDFEALIAFRRQFLPTIPDAQLREATRINYVPLDDGRWGWRCDPRFLDRGPMGANSSEETSWSALRAITCPVLHVVGERSVFQRWREQAERMMREMRDCRMVMIPGAGHNVHVEKPDEFLAAVRDFLNASA